MENKGHVAINMSGSGSLDVALAREEALHRFRDINWATYTRYLLFIRFSYLLHILVINVALLSYFGVDYLVPEGSPWRRRRSMRSRTWKASSSREQTTPRMSRQWTSS